MKSAFQITYRRTGQATRHTAFVEAATPQEAITKLINERAWYRETVIIMWVC